MNPTLVSAFEKLTFAIKSNDEQSVKSIDSSLETIAEERDPVSVAFLLLSLEDDFSFDEGMFSVIHTAEAFDDQEYVAGFLAAIPHILTTAPKWASIVLMRILNSEETKRELIRALVKSDASVKKSVEDLCNRINGQSTDFLSKTVAVLVATK
ncbi:Imm30 family immunity protein [Oxalobacteraceae bacterium OTU3CAMAD1]|nr:Imm30 family immunity protein [Oxalobacteraceae bacterium OTU3CAMAD1]